MFKVTKRIFLHMSKWIGLFRLSKYFTRKGLRILCYHGFALDDEYEWLPGMFIRSDTFRKRLEFLRKKRFPVLSLDQALQLLSVKKLPSAATVITIDDGFFSTKSLAHEVLAEKSYSYTIYITSYYSLKETPIFNLVVPYMFWKTSRNQIDLGEIGNPLTGTAKLSDTKTKSQVIQQILDYGHSQLDYNGRCDLMKRLGEHLEVDYSKIEETRILSLLTASEISELAAAGVDIQLHTHRHRWQSLNTQTVVRELIDNKSYLEPLVGKKLQHFCYPSGAWRPELLTYLETAGIKSATTCESGLNYSWTPRLALKRFLDDENISQIEFEAMMCGYWGYIQKLKTSFFTK